VLAVAVCAVLAGARSLAAIGEWASGAPGQVLAALGVRRDPWTGVWRPPGEATVRRVLARIDPDALDRAIGAWLGGQQPPPPTIPPPATPAAWRRAVAVDGKTLRGIGHHGAAQVHLLPDGEPLHHRGVVAGAPGLYFAGRFFQYALTSSLIYGVGRDAEHIAAQIASRDAVRLAPP
jgi:hypothetical protein